MVEIGQFPTALFAAYPHKLTSVGGFLPLKPLPVLRFRLFGDVHKLSFPLSVKNSGKNRIKCFFVGASVKACFL
jgi:hypothetical protein